MTQLADIRSNVRALLLPALAVTVILGMGCDSELLRKPADGGPEAPAAAPPVESADADEVASVEALQSELDSIAVAMEEDLSVAAPIPEPAPDPVVEEEAPTELALADPADPDEENPFLLPELGPWLADPALMEDPESRYFVAVAREIATMRADLERLRMRMDGMLDNEADMLRRENAELRRELERLRAGGAPVSPFLNEGGPGARGYASPADRFEQAATSAAPMDPIPRQSAPVWEASDELTEGTETRGENGMALVASSETQYAVLVEWGRSPDEAASLGETVRSLQGMICVVPAGTPEGDLVTLGQQLQYQYGDYDNINIQVFDNAEAAKLYAQTNSQELGGPVLRISRFQATGQDAVEIARDGVYVPAEELTALP